MYGTVKSEEDEVHYFMYPSYLTVEFHCDRFSCFVVQKSPFGDQLLSNTIISYT